jgi:hypothetical protein
MVDLTIELKNAGFLVGPLDVLVQKRMYNVFMPHGLGHPVVNQLQFPYFACQLISIVNARDSRFMTLYPLKKWI